MDGGLSILFLKLTQILTKIRPDRFLLLQAAYDKLIHIYETRGICDMNTDRHEKIEQYAREVLTLARDTITVKFRFFDAALAKLKLESKPGLKGFATDGEALYYDPAYLLTVYMDEPNVAVRLYLHVLFHCVFFHRFRSEKLNENYWNMATDIAVENIILELDLPAAALTRDGEEKNRLVRLKKMVPDLTAEKIYREFAVSPPSAEAEREYKRLFTVDAHDAWRASAAPEELIVTEEQWKKITERMKSELKNFSTGKTGSESLENNLDEATKTKYDYREILERFMVSGEEITVNDDEFDYIYYTYGLSVYGNLPLVEPLEYKEVNKVREIVIAIDTSASCRGEIVRQFLTRTYEILKGTENFFHQVNVHIVQCDAEIRSDTKIVTDADFEHFVKHGKLTGFGTTDFRPVFDYVDKLKRDGEFTNLKGLIYFTDGYGIYPETVPDYDVIFAFTEEDKNRQPVPGWAIKVILEDELDEYK